MRRLTRDLAPPGEPLPQDVFNRAGQRLAESGSTPGSERLYRELLDFGFVSGAPGDPAPHPADAGVLIADDTPLLLDMLEKSLRNLGLRRILRAEDGELALARVSRYRPDLVFLDIDMPRLDGLTVLKTLRRDLPDLFICMLSAHSSVQNVRAAVAAGAAGFLVKPFQQVRLESVVSQFLKRHQTAASGTPPA
jgi:two-component system chemotaxis response regulator CheY